MNSSKETWVLPIIFCFIWGACSDGHFTGSTPGIAPVSNPEITIASDRPLTVVTHDYSSAISSTSGGIIATGNGLQAANEGLPTVNLPVPPTNNSAQGSGTPVLPSGMKAHEFDNTSFTAKIRVQINSDLTPSASCSVIGSTVPIACAPSWFDIDSSQLRFSSGRFGISINGAIANFLTPSLSNTLPVTLSSIKQISDTNPGGANSDSPMGFVIMGGKLIFSAANSRGAFKLFEYDQNRIVQVSNTMNDNSQSDDANSISPEIYTQASGETAVYFKGRTSTGGLAPSRLFSYDGAIVKQISNLTPNNSLGDLFGLLSQNLQTYQGSLFLVMSNSRLATKLFRFDGTKLTPISNTSSNAGTGDFFAQGQLVKVGNLLYFIARDARLNTKLFSTDGTSVRQITNLMDSNEDFPSINRIPPTVGDDGNLYFTAYNSVRGVKLYRFDGTTLLQLTNTTLTPGGDDSIDSFKLYNGTLYFTGNTPGSSGVVNKLMRIQGSVTEPVTNTSGSNATTDSALIVAVAQGKLIFSALDANGARGLYSYDGKVVQSITTPIALPIYAWSYTYLLDYAGKSYFSAPNAAGSTKLFAYDGVNWMQISNTSSDANVSDSIYFPVIYSKKLFFSASTPQGGSKLFALCDPAAGCTP